MANALTTRMQQHVRSTNMQYNSQGNHIPPEPVCNDATCPQQWKSSTDSLDRSFNYHSIMVGDSHPCTFVQGYLDVPTLVTTLIHSLLPWTPLVPMSMLWNSISCLDDIPTQVLVLATLLLFLPAPSATQSRLEVPCCLTT